MGLLSTRSRHSCSVTCSWLTPFWETEFGTSARDQFGAMVSRQSKQRLHSLVQSGKLSGERGCYWQMHRKVDRCQHAQRGEKGYGTQIGIAQNNQQTGDEIRRGLGLTGYGYCHC